VYENIKIISKQFIHERGLCESNTTLNNFGAHARSPLPSPQIHTERRFRITKYYENVNELWSPYICYTHAYAHARTHLWIVYTESQILIIFGIYSHLNFNTYIRALTLNAKGKLWKNSAIPEWFKSFSNSTIMIFLGFSIKRQLFKIFTSKYGYIITPFKLKPF